jgi:hypothetical protein
MIDLNVLKWSGGVLAGIAWFALVLMGKADSATFVQFAQMVLVGLGAHGMTLSKPPSTTPLTKESGKISLLLLIAIFVAIATFAGLL